MSGDATWVTIPCSCEGTPHPEGDKIRLADELPMEAGIAAATALGTIGKRDPTAAIVGAILRNGAIEEWNLLDAKGGQLPLDSDAIAARLTWAHGGPELFAAILQKYLVGDGAAPLGSTSSPKTTAPSSRAGRTARLTSVKTSSSSEPLEPSA